MNVLCVTQNLPPVFGGIAVFLHNLCTQLCRLKYHVDVLAPAVEGCADVDKEQPYRVYRYISRQRLSSIVAIRRMLVLHQRYHYDVVLIGHFMTTHALGALALRKLWDVPYVILCHGNDLHYSINNWIDRVTSYPLFHNASLILCNSYATAERVRRKGYQGEVEILHPGVDLEKFRPNLEISAITQKYHLDGRRVILSVSRLVKRKGHEDVLRALTSVIKQIPAILYLIAGQGEEEVPLRRLVAELNLEQYVVFAGYVKQDFLPALYCACDVFVMPSFEQDGGNDYEGFGIVFSEANACGKPVIGGRSGGMGDAIIDGETGLLVDPHNSEEIAEAIIKILTSWKVAQNLAENGRRRVERELSWGQVGKLASTLFEGIVNRSKCEE